MISDLDGCCSQAQTFCMSEQGWVRKTAEHAAHRRGLDDYAEDIAQDVFDRVRKVADDAWASIQKKKAYLARIIINRANDLCIGDHSFLPLTDLILSSDPLEAMEDAIMLQELYNKLSPSDQKLLELLYDGCSSAEIAETLGITDPTARKRISRLMQKLNLLSQGIALKPKSRFGTQLDAQVEKN